MQNTATHKGLDHTSGKGRSRASRTTKGLGKGGSTKLQCQFIIGIEEDSKFQVVRRIIGWGNMKRIAEQSGAKMRLRGRGSKFLEGPEHKESKDDLMLCVSSQDRWGFDEARRLVSELLLEIYGNYEAFCRRHGKKVPHLRIEIHDGYREGSR